ncbi:Omp28-related outer membrane protein [Porphyromonas crevioricanis]|uniref:Outer membrane protein Omp28 n=1 Tax=Porphyromonas crevioricanis TaxID=393921 RepID=A0AB34PGC0_9PORP|nr:Omp28-related outer membrane protein [Porphyromonas crevioricanis]KGN95324.1 hypothetical protein HQ38_03255 [Porphyromonas crevioricanis]
MKKLFIFCITIALASAVRLFAQANSQDIPLMTSEGRFYWGYCDLESPLSRPGRGYPKGFIGNDTKISSFARFKADKTKAYSGAKVLGMRVGVCADIPSAELFVRNTLEGTSPLLSKVTNLRQGWNEVFFNNSYSLEEKDVVFGYTYTQKDVLASPFVISVDEVISAPMEGNYISLNGGPPTVRTHEQGCLRIQLILDGDHPEFHNKTQIADLKLSPVMNEKGEITAKYKLYNMGSNRIEKVEISYYVDNKLCKQSEHVTSLLPLEPLEIEDKEIKVLGGKELGVKVSKVNDQKIFSQPSVFSLEKILEKAYPRKVLLENFSTEFCSSCPGGHSQLKELIGESFSDKVTWVVHHVGFTYDKFTLEESKSLEMLYGDPHNPPYPEGPFAPAISLDRTSSELKILSTKEKFPAHRIFSKDKEKTKMFFEEAVERPALLTIELTEAYRAEDHSLNISISGETLPMLAGKDIYANIYIVEDHIYSTDQVGTGTDENGKRKPFIHNGVLRKFVTPIAGELIKVSAENKYSFETACTLDRSWNPANLRIVAFVAKALKSDPLDCQVYNAEETIISTFKNVDLIQDDAQTLLFVKNGTIFCSGEASIDSVYSLEGKRCLNEGLESGVYVIRVRKGNKMFVRKINIE